MAPVCLFTQVISVSFPIIALDPQSSETTDSSLIESLSWADSSLICVFVARAIISNCLLILQRSSIFHTLNLIFTLAADGEFGLEWLLN